MFKVIALLTRRSDVAPDWLRDYYENHHVPLIVSVAPPPRVYKRNYVHGDTGPNVITELVFDDREAYDRWVGAMYAPESGVAADEEKFLDRSQTVSFVVDEHTHSDT